MGSIEALPPELLLQIFSHYIKAEGHAEFLKRLAPVCKLWEQLSTTPSLWRTVNEEKSWNSVLNFSKKGLLYYTENLHLPGYRRYPLNILDVLRNINEVKKLDMSANIVNRGMMMQVAKYCPTLETLVLQSVRVQIAGFRRVTLYDLQPALAGCGQTLKHLNLSYIRSSDPEQLIKVVADMCPSLEKFQFLNLDFNITLRNVPFPIHKLESGCLKLKELEFSGCNVIGQRDRVGFQNMKKFTARRCNFYNADLYSILENCTVLENLQINFNRHVIVKDIWKIPSDRLRVLDVAFENQKMNLKALEKAIDKWKHTMVELRLRGWIGDVTNIFEIILQNNPNPKFQSLLIEMTYVDINFLKNFVQECQNLNNIFIKWRLRSLFSHFKTRKEVEKILEMPSEGEVIDFGSDIA